MKLEVKSGIVCYTGNTADVGRHSRMEENRAEDDKIDGIKKRIRRERQSQRAEPQKGKPAAGSEDDS